MNRKSVRVFEDKEITPEIKDIILAAAMRAPTGGNCMPYSIIDVTDQSIKDKLAETCDHQPFIAQAKMVLIFCADYHRWYRKFKMAGCEDIPAPELSNMVLATEDAVIAAHTACIAAESLGIGSCYIGDIVENFEIHKELLNLPRRSRRFACWSSAIPPSSKRKESSQLVLQRAPSCLRTNTASFPKKSCLK